MKINREVIEKEIKYISLKLQMCKDINEAHILFYNFEMLNNIYEDITGKKIKRPKLAYIKEDDLLLSYDLKQDASYNSLLNRFEDEKESLTPLIRTYLRTFFVDNDGEYTYNCHEDKKTYSQEETRKIMLDFFSKYGEYIYSIVERMFSNNQIQMGFKKGDQQNDYESELEEAIDFYGNLDSSIFESESLEKFVSEYARILDEIDEKYDISDGISDRDCLDYLDALSDLYMDLETKDGIEKPMCPEYDFVGSTIAYTYSFPALKKIICSCCE